MLGAITRLDAFAIAAGGCLIAFALLGLRSLGRAEIVLLSGTLVLGILVVLFARAPTSVILHGFAQGAAYASLILALSFVQAPAEGSPMVRRCGTYLIQQGPGRRYLALTAGAHLFGSILNLGAIGLLGTMTQQSNTLANAGGDKRVVEIRHRRMSTALLRGFGTTTLWSTGSVAPSVMLSLFPTVSWFELARNGLPLAIALMGIGWMLDRLQWPASTRLQVRIAESDDTAVGALLPMVAVVAAIIAGVVAVKQLAGWPLSVAVVFTVPLAAVVWLLVQYRSPAVALRLLGEHCSVRLPRMRWEVLGLGSAGFIGAAIAALVPPDAATGLLDAVGLPPAALLVVVSAVMLGLGQVGINPIVASSILGGALVHLAHQSVPPMALILTLMGPWALYPMVSPLAASTIMCARFADTTPMTVGWRWNGVFMVLSFVLTASLAVLITVLG